MTALGGVGLGWRPELAGLALADPLVAFTEVVAESLDGRGPPAALAQFRDSGRPVVVHGVSLSLGGADPVDRDALARLVAVAEQVSAPVVSEHIAFVRAGGLEAGHLLPVPRSRDALEVLVANVHVAQAELPVPLALEPIAALFGWPDDELAEHEFLTELVERTGAKLLLDLANLYANARNGGPEPADLLDRLPLERVAYCHVAGGEECVGIYHDTHTHPVRPAVLDLVAEFAARRPDAAVLLERDGAYPAPAELQAELTAIGAAMRGTASAPPGPSLVPHG